MTDFQRENRYIVIKRNHASEDALSRLEGTMDNNGVTEVEDALVVESDWPEYEPVWKMIEDRVTGAPVEGGKAEYDAMAKAMTKDKTVTMSRELALFESILGNKPDAFLHEPVYQVTESEVLEFARQIAAPVVERQPFRFLVKSCYGPRSKSIENADESMRESIESARQYFGAENEIDADKAKAWSTFRRENGLRFRSTPFRLRR